MNIDQEGAKWLNLAFKTYGLDGVTEMARALGFSITRLETRKRVGVAETKDDTGSDIWREPVRMPAMCPQRKPIGDSQWKPYEGFPSVFRCGYEGYLENRRPSRSQPIAECFYDELGQLVDQNHPYGGCRGTPNRYPARAALRRKDGIRFGKVGSAISTGSSVRAGDAPDMEHLTCTRDRPRGITCRQRRNFAGAS